MARVEREEDDIWACKCGDGRKVMFCAEKFVEYSGYFSALMHSQMKETKDRTLDLRLFSSDSIKLLLKMFDLKDRKLLETEVAENFQDSLDLGVIEDVLKAITRIKSPVQLIEFGICLHENFVYLTGGQRSPSDEAKFAVKGAYRMDPHIGEWTEISHMKEARCLFCLCNIWGCLYAVGGANQYGILSSTEYYIPEEDQWYMGPTLTTPLHEHAGCVFRSKLYISGGHDDIEHTDKVLVLESKEGIWKPVEPLLQPRSYHAMVALHEKMYVVGGCRKFGDEIKDIYSVEEYDPVSNTWTHLLNLNVPISGCLPVVIDNEILFVGGYSFDQKAYLQQVVSLDLRKRQWKFSTVETSLPKKVVGYACLKLKVKQRILR